MLIPELIKRAVAGELRFDFIESTITMSGKGTLSSIKGRGYADPAGDGFHYHFLPRGPFAEEWVRVGGEGAEVQESDRHNFCVGGVERGSATWTAAAASLRFLNGSRGPAMHARVQEWSHSDERSVHLSFVRAVVPGRFDYPVTVRHAAGLDARTASVQYERAKIDFRDYGHYTEVCASSPDELPEHFAKSAVHALGVMLDRPLESVYRERHADKQRVISVRTRGVPDDGPTDNPDSAASKQPCEAFWASYVRHLHELL